MDPNWVVKKDEWSSDSAAAIRFLFDENAIRRRVAALAGEIAADHGDTPPVIVGIRNGAVPFMMDLLRALPASWRPDLAFDFLDATSYAGSRSAGDVRLAGDLVVDLEGRAVLVVDGIVDTGRTMRAVLRHLRQEGPSRLRVCTLLDKPSRRRVPVPIDYRGFEVEDVFVVGYGLDLDQRYRGLPHVGVLEAGP